MVIQRVLNEYTTNKEDQEFINNYIFNSPEWLGCALIDTGYITINEAISMVQDRTNHVKDDLISDFWNKYTDYAYVNDDVLELIKKLKKNDYQVYLLSNMNVYMYESIYKTLINRYKLVPKDTLFIDDNIKNVDTAEKLGCISKMVKPDDYDSVIDCLVNEQINLK